MNAFFYQLASPPYFYRFAGKLIPWFWLLCVCTGSYGLIAGLLFAPADYQQKDAFRIIYIHVPSAALSLGLYSAMAVTSLIFLVWRIKLADMIAKACAPLGASLTAITLITGSLWGKPMWGTWWIWDARLTSELILLFLYFGILALRSALIDRDLAARASAIITLIGAIDLPIIHYSVIWWNSLHQGASILQFAKPTIAPAMLYPLLALFIALTSYCLAVVLMATRNECLVRERKTRWVQELPT